MSLRIGMILSKDCLNHKLDHFREKYHYKFIVKDNQDFREKQLKPDEILIEPTGYYDDSETGIGSFKYYNKNPKSVYKSVRSESRDLYSSFVKEAVDRNNHYYNDALIWKNIIFEMKVQYHFVKVGVFYFGGYTVTEEMRFPMFTRRACDVYSLTPEDLMKIKENEILFFV